MGKIFIFLKKLLISLIIIFIFSCQYKPLIRELPSGKKIKELGFQDFYVIGKNERNFIYEYQTEIGIDNEEEIKNEAKEIFCQLKKILDFNKYDYITIKSSVIYKRIFIFNIKGGKVYTFKPNENLCN